MRICVVLPYSRKFSWDPIFVDGRVFCLIFMDACNHAHYTLYNCTYFAGLIFADISNIHENLDPMKISRYTVL
jgi:hypothetical protein